MLVLLCKYFSFLKYIINAHGNVTQDNNNTITVSETAIFIPKDSNDSEKSVITTETIFNDINGSFL